MNDSFQLYSYEGLFNYSFFSFKEKIVFLNVVS